MTTIRTLTLLVVATALHGAPAVSQPRTTGPDRTSLPIAEPKRPVYTEIDARKVTPPPRFEVKAPAGAPNVVIVLIDDLGFGAPSTFGGPIGTPTLDQLAENGLRFNNFHTTALCSPTRAALKSGRNHHTVNMGFITEMATAIPGSHRPESPAPPRRSPKCCG
jgi:hypothetical protein